MDFPKLPLPPMLMFDEVTSIKETGGAYNKGTAHAQFKITPDKWFFLVTLKMIQSCPVV